MLAYPVLFHGCTPGHSSVNLFSCGDDEEARAKAAAELLANAMLTFAEVIRPDQSAFTVAR